MAVVMAGMRRRREERLARMTAVAEAAQLALLPPLPPEMTGISIAARYRSATREASVGGDLYEIIPTGYGIRVIIGDVRGKGLDAVLLARHVLSAFRRSAVALPALEHVAGEVGRAIGPHLSAEDFVTAALAQITPCAARHRELRLGIQEDPRRAAQARPPGQRIHHPPCPQGPEDPPGARAAHRHDVAAVPAHAGRPRTAGSTSARLHRQAAARRPTGCRIWGNTATPPIPPGSPARHSGNRTAAHDRRWGWSS